jgi:hypothetical protein
MAGTIYGGAGNNVTLTVGTDGVINGRGVVWDTDNGGVKLGGAKGIGIGVANGGKVNGHDGTSTNAYQAGDVIGVQVEGMAYVEIGAAVSQGDPLAMDADAQFIKFVQANQGGTYVEANVEGIIDDARAIMAIAFEDGSTAGDYVLAKLCIR